VRDRFGIFGTVTRFRELSLFLVMMLRIPNKDYGSGSIGSRGRKRKNRPRQTRGRGLYAPESGSPDALKVALDAFGDHRTHAQRGLQLGMSPDVGHRTLAVASGALGHAW